MATAHYTISAAAHVVLANGTIEIARLLSLPLSNGCPAPWSGNPWLGQGFTDHVDAYAGSVVPIEQTRFHALFDSIMLKGLKYTPKIKLSQLAQRRDRLLGIAAMFLFNSRYKEDLDRLKVLVKALLHGKIDRSLLAIPGRLLPVSRIAIPLIARYLLHRRTYNVADRGIQLRLTSEQIPLKNKPPASAAGPRLARACRWSRSIGVLTGRSSRRWRSSAR